MKKIYIAPRPVELLVESIISDQPHIMEVNHVEYTARIDHGDSQLFSVDVYVEKSDGTGKKLEVTISIDMKVRGDY